MGESRTELLAWLNELLTTRYNKVEQAGTGAAYCQIFDSIYGDVKLNKVKFDVKNEYEYGANFKVLQETFKKHKIDKIIPVDKLIKCKLQDNLEFMQWVKKFWDQNYPGGQYDAVNRKGTRSSTTNDTSMTPGSGRASSAGRKTKTPVILASNRSASRGGRTSVLDNHSASMIIDLNKQIAELKLTVDGLEKERDFYFGKLRDIEIEVQVNMENMENMENMDLEARLEETTLVFKKIETILYSTEDGFEVPPEEISESLGYEEDETF